MAEKKPGGDISRRTRMGYAIPHVPQPDEADEPTIVNRPSTDVSLPEAPARQEPARKTAPTIEVEYIRETDLSLAKSGPAAMLEIWTRNRIYYVDAQMNCVAVINRATGRAEADHSLLGAKLTGGQRRSKNSNAVEIVFPLPVPGTEAAFRKDGRRHGQYGHTSTIERVVLKVRKIVVGAVSATEPLWDEITGRFQIK